MVCYTDKFMVSISVASLSRSNFARCGLPASRPRQNGDLSIPFEQILDLLRLAKTLEE
jgi:hypothetical protein